MKTGHIILLCIVIIFCFMIIKIIYDSTVKQKRLRLTLIDNYGKLPNNDYSAGRYEGISCYYNEKEKKSTVIDDITWNDLDFETIFMIINNTCSGIGEEYLYALLHMPYYEIEPLKERDRIITYFDEHVEERVKIQLELKKLGKLQNASIGQYLSNIKSIKPHNPIFHITVFILMIISILGCFINTSIFVPFLLIMIVVNCITYFQYKAKISSYFVVFSYLSRLTQTGYNIASLKCKGINKFNERLLNCTKPLKNICRFSWLFVSGTDFRSDLIALLLDYVKMITHFDLIIFDRMVYSLYKYRNELDQMMDILGEVDSDIAIGSYRRYIGDGWCKPQFQMDKKPIIHCEQVYHPLIINPIKNNLYEDKSVLITGSNASGKSTFLKTLAINAILAQTIYTCLADTWDGCFYRIYSSMALTDNIAGNESYYIVEIKSLKRIIDAVEKDHTTVLCFIDEVLRGTNTVERIAASSRILHALNQKNALCFAATHDIELTSILEHSYSNYHFKEEVIDHQVVFDYDLKKGRATSRNAIKLLDMLGFEKEITNDASLAAKDFENQGFWSMIRL